MPADVDKRVAKLRELWNETRGALAGWG